MIGIFGRSLVIIAAVMVPCVARAANPSPSDVATARELYKKGADALDAGNPQAAIPNLVSAWSLVQTPVIGYDLARAQMAIGHLVEAREAALSIERLAAAPDETPRSKQARVDAEKIAAQLEPRIPHLTIDVQGLAGHEATVKIDGQNIPSAALTVARQANPGSHMASVDTDDGRHGEGHVDLVERETKAIVIQLDAPAANAKLPVVIVDTEKNKTTPAIAPLAPTPERSHPSPLVWIGVVTAGVGIAAGAITGAFALSESNVVKQNCTMQSPTDSKYVCVGSYVNDLSAANTLGVVSTVGFIVGGVGIAVMVTGFILGPTKSRQSSARILPFLGPISGVRGEF